MVYVLKSPAGDTFTVTVLPTVEATFLIAINVPELGSVLTVRVGVTSFLLTNNIVKTSVLEISKIVNSAQIEFKKKKALISDI